MITAAAALQLPSAQLTDEELRQFDRLMTKIDDVVWKQMTYCGVDMVLDPREATPNVVNAVNLALKQLGYNMMVQQIMGEDGGIVVGGRTIPKLQAWAVKIIPTPEAYAEAGVVPTVKEKASC